MPLRLQPGEDTPRGTLILALAGTGAGLTALGYA
jgi:hypothetical protein